MGDVLEHAAEGNKVDKACVGRREEVRRQIAGHHPGDPVPQVEYSPEENSLWQTVISMLNRLHPATACTRYLQAADRLVLPVTRVPSLRNVSAELTSLTGFRLLPAENLVPAEDFYRTFADSCFYSTMYMRCPAVPLYSPDPDILHELVGHAVTLSDPLFADLYRAFGDAAARVRSKAKIQAISKVFWFTMETGLVREASGLRAYGAALISSAAELKSITQVALEEFSIEKMLRQPYDIYQYQPLLFVVDSIEILSIEIRNFLSDQLS